jgi:hypothetical protein
MKEFITVILMLTMMVVRGGLAIADEASTAGSFTCSGGTAASPTIIPGGTYTHLTVTGICRILGSVTGPTIGPGGTEVITNCNAASGPVNVLGGVTIAPNGFLDAGSCAPKLNVSGGIAVGSAGGLVLGCSPFLVVAPPTPPFPSLCPGITTSNVIKGGVTAIQPTTLIFHSNTIYGGLSVQGGGGGVNCNSNANLSAAFDGTSATYTDFEDNTISGGVSISGLQSCWFGIFRSHVNGSVSVTNNTFADPDATEVATNVVKGNLTCLGNSPAAQIGDSQGSPNVVTGQKLGECANL